MLRYDRKYLCLFIQPSYLPKEVQDFWEFYSAFLDQTQAFGRLSDNRRSNEHKYIEIRFHLRNIRRFLSRRRWLRNTLNQGIHILLCSIFTILSFSIKHLFQCYLKHISNLIKLRKGVLIRNLLIILIAVNIMQECYMLAICRQQNISKGFIWCAIF